MRKLTGILLAMTILVTLFTCAVFAGSKYQDGSYVVFIPNSHGDFIAEFSFKNDYIVGVEVISPLKKPTTYSYAPGIEADDLFPSQVLLKQGGPVDAVSGATSSNKTHNEAVQIALALASGTYNGDVYYGLSRDYAHGHVVVKVTVDKVAKKIKSVEIIPAQFASGSAEAARDTRAPNKPVSYPYQPAIDAYLKVPSQIVAKQSVKVDGVSGATSSTRQYGEAVISALKQIPASAGFNVESFMK